MATKAYDDRGRVVELCRLRDLPEDGRWTVEYGRRQLWVWLFVGAFVGQFIIHMVIAEVRGTWNWTIIGGNAFMAFIGLLTGISIMLMMRPEVGLKKVLLAEMKQRGLCAACGFDLRGAKAAIDGCTVCPECAAAWRFTSADGEAGA